VTYRDDHEAARHRADALERELAIARRDQRALDRGRPGGFDWNAVVGPFLGAGSSGAFTVLALWFGWSVWWAVAGFAVFAITVVALLAGGGSRPHPLGAVPVRIETGGRILLALVRMHTGDHKTRALELYAGHSLDEVSAAAAIVLEPIAIEGKEGEIATAVARERLAAVGLELEHLWISPAPPAAP
jgi:hypothetical protein